MTREPRPASPNQANQQTIRPGLVLGILAAAGIASFAIYFWQIQTLSKPTLPDDIQSIEVPKAHLPVGPIAKNSPPSTALGKREPGMPLPPTLLSRLNRERTFWYVGKTTTESLVEIPFPPGQLPGRPTEHASVQENPGFLGANSCQDCHQENYETFVKTAHHLTSRTPSIESIAGSFAEGTNIMRTKDPQVSFRMVARDSRFFQQVRFYDWELEVPIDLVIGSSKLGQAFLYWDFNALYQTHVTYLTETNCWTNSPGYLDGDAAYARPIRGRCMECHATYADVGIASNQYNPNSIILGISCERCHGPGQEHVAFHQANPLEKNAAHVTVPSKLTRTQQIDVCGQCHSGGSQPKGRPFAFRPGDRLEDHYHELNESEQSNSVHASNQATRLAKSKCFQSSQMACVECHNPHRNERNQAALFSSRCLKCHQSEQCGQAQRLGNKIQDNCIDCHMPKEATNNMSLDGEAGTVFPPLRDHHIRIDLKATERFYREPAK